ncbi:MAG TPA: hypothetical protein VLV48_09655, partial [Thermoanaerobaculia bacterium]|nr:hypothetical protein [Thermoanaerobaculia bacterium]
RIEGGGAVYRKRPEFKERYARLALNEDADAIVEQIDGERSATEVAAVSNLDVFAVYKLLLALESLGMVERDKPEVLHEVSPSFTTPVPPLLTVDREEETPPLIEPPLPEPPLGAVGMGGLEEPATEAAWNPPDLDAPSIEEIPAAEAFPHVERVPRKRSLLRSLVPVGVLVLLAAVAWGGWLWWSGREQAERQPAVENAAAPRPSREEPPASAASAPAPAPGTAVPTETVASVPPAVAQPVPTRPAPQPVPPVAASGEPRRERYQDMAEAFRREGRSVAYTLQFEIVCQTESVTKALAAGSSVWFVPIQYRGAACFRVFWGRYETREAAERARYEIPAPLRGSGPVVVQPRELLR